MSKRAGAGRQDDGDDVQDNTVLDEQEQEDIVEKLREENRQLDLFYKSSIKLGIVLLGLLNIYWGALPYFFATTPKFYTKNALFALASFASSAVLFFGNIAPPSTAAPSGSSPAMKAKSAFLHHSFIGGFLLGIVPLYTTYMHHQELSWDLGMWVLPSLVAVIMAVTVDQMEELKSDIALLEKHKYKVKGA
ncbi:uncharacterized protein BJ171DRAFT_598330 [Polychytrium aggregatum]|uniref:uncharacterized protein n=1 Tax=Polychytrium aggregatum TaxID=110093 RepID=UPI0022FDD323|nr:uncharacterized protein BJ171DRAFT_598330 [Polychytrium aggregatum]KAI9205673.1 hypothetical protein BJ171DRAFT_598330 [Polychytrium aggregatum]